MSGRSFSTFVGVFLLENVIREVVETALNLQLLGQKLPPRLNSFRSLSRANDEANGHPQIILWQ
jgi:hypothetical protein